MKRLNFSKNSYQEQSQTEPITADEVVSRFIFNSSQLNKAKTVIKASAFLPPENLKTSVFRKNRMSPDEYRETKIVISEKRDKDIKVTALIGVSSVKNSGVMVEPEESEHKWHADIIGWPDDKDKRKSIAQALVKDACLE